MNSGLPNGEYREPILLPEVSHKPLPRQITTLAFLSGQIPAPLICEHLARSVCDVTEASVVLVRLESQEGADNGDNVSRTDHVSLNGEFHLPSHIRRTEVGFHSLTISLRHEPTPASIASLASQLGRHFRYVLIATPVEERPAPWFFELLHRSNLAYLFLRGSAEDVYHLDQIMREVRGRYPNGGVHVKPIAYLADGEQIDGFDTLAHRVGSPVHLFVHGTPASGGVKEAALQSRPTDLFRADLRRLAREIGGCLVGLALSSGAAKGFAHIGVIQVLEENGIEVDVIAGASMGAYVGACWAFGCDGRELERLARELEGRWTLWRLIDPTFPPRRGFLRGLAVKKRLMRSLAHARFGDLVRPMRVIATNLATLERMVFSSGEVATAVHASIAVPGICVPISLDGEAYVDGGIVDPLPVDILREMGVARVIAVNVIPTPDRIRYGLQAERELTRNDGSENLFHKVLPIDRQMNYFARGNLFEILMRSVHGAQIRMAEASCRRADLVLRPDICDDRWLDFRNPGKFITLGREVTERHLDEIKALVGRKEVVHEQEFAPETMAAFI